MYTPGGEREELIEQGYVFSSQEQSDILYRSSVASLAVAFGGFGLAYLFTGTDRSELVEFGSVVGTLAVVVAASQIATSGILAWRRRKDDVDSGSTYEQIE